jgi:DNA-directed RNA polymerase specialized sigma24 family protein
MDRLAIAGTEESDVSDEDLVLLARGGDRSAFGELWTRHARSGITVARRFTSSLDADDLVAEAFARNYPRVLDGGGPDGAFRP